MSPSREGEQGNAPLFLRACLHEYGKTYTLEIRGFSVCGQDVTKASLRFHLSEVSGVSGRSLSCLVAAAPLRAGAWKTCPKQSTQAGQDT